MEPRGTLGPMRYQPEEAADTPRWGLPRAVIVMLGMAGAVIVVAGTAPFATLLTELLPLAADRRTHPGDYLLSFIAADSDLELDDVVITAVIIAIAGRETTANLLGAAVIRLMTPGPDGIRPVDSTVAVDDRLITELLRLDGPVQAVARIATHSHVINDITIHAGEPALVVLAANRDPAFFNRPGQLQVDRPGPAPLTFVRRTWRRQVSRRQPITSCRVRLRSLARRARDPSGG